MNIYCLKSASLCVKLDVSHTDKIGLSMHLNQLILQHGVFYHEYYL